MKGTNGGWSILFGNTPVRTNEIDLAIDEDQVFDSERKHIAEDVHFLVINKRRD